ACALGASAGCGDVGRVLLESDRDRALELLGAACRAHDGSSCYELGLAAKSQARAQREFVRACNLGFAAGCISAAWTFDPAERSPAALSWMDRACDERAVAACELLADRLGAFAVREDDVSTVLRATSVPATARAFAIEILAGPDAGLAVNLAEGMRILVGQSPVCELRLADPQVSRRHLALENAGDRVRLVDLDSTNGTFVN